MSPAAESSRPGFDRNTTLSKPRLEAARRRVSEDLLSERAAKGHWVGELSTSALSTATAVTALALVDRAQGTNANHSLVQRGLEWLADHANSDGGWGDTLRSYSNISTTTLCWAAYGAVSGAADRFRPVVARAEEWLQKRAGSLDPAPLASAISVRYGKDRTFSVPILTMCALSGRFGSGADAWKLVRQLPFELAALPHQVYGAARMPVVSYALPALIAIGHARHYFRPTRNPITRLFRSITRERTLRILESIQPANGGFLEATPLTSFVTMSLAAIGLAGHPVAKRGVAFLRSSVRPDGSWPIDTNLATWVTTLSANALRVDEWSHEEKRRICHWILAQQYREEHPYTHAAPGGWAWTDLPGGVPDADDTAGALLALHKLRHDDADVRAAARMGVEWLLDLQNRDGGIPTFCRGWGTLGFDCSSPDLTAHALRAWTAWRSCLEELHPAIDHAAGRAIRYLGCSQQSDGSWRPLWFGHQDSEDDENPLYGTARVLVALAERSAQPGCTGMIERAMRWLTKWQHPSGGWSGAHGAAPSIEETSLAVEALAAIRRGGVFGSNGEEALRRGTLWLVERVESGAFADPAPIGFYFARLWYYERLYPKIFLAAALKAAS